MYKKIRENNQQNIDLLNTKRAEFKNKLWNPISFDKVTDTKTNSWFDISEKYNHNCSHDFDFIKSDKLDVPTFKCKKVVVKPSKFQTDVLLKWMESYIRMENETIKFFKKRHFDHEPTITNFQVIRTKYLKGVKETIWKNTQLPNYKHNTKINKHILDEAIKDVCTMYKSCFANMKANNLKHFRVRYIKQNKPKKIIKLESRLFSKEIEGFCVSVIGEIEMNGDNFDSKNMKHTCTLQYNANRNNFTLYVPIDINEDINEEKNDKLNIGIDPGITPFLNGYTETHCIEICKNIKDKIAPILRKIDKLQSVNRHKGMKKRYNKIENLINDLHWKTIEYLTNNYKVISLGNLSTKDISKCKHLNKMSKRLGFMLRLYVFRERLKYKCAIKGIKYINMKENMTTKLCSLCGFVNEIGSSKIYKCKKCKNEVARDLNSAKNIFMLSLE